MELVGKAGKVGSGGGLGREEDKRQRGKSHKVPHGVAEMEGRWRGAEEDGWPMANFWPLIRSNHRGRL